MSYNICEIDENGVFIMNHDLSFTTTKRLSSRFTMPSYIALGFIPKLLSCLGGLVVREPAW